MKTNEKLRLEIAKFIMTPKTCGICKKLVTDEDCLIFMYHVGMCPSCDHVAGEVAEEMYDYQTP